MLPGVTSKPFIAAGLAAFLAAAAPPVEFVPVTPQFAPAGDEYRRVWESDGARIAAALEQAAGLSFPPGRIDAIVSEGRPMTAYDGRTIRLRASYSPAYKKATLVHELGHRLALALPRAASSTTTACSTSSSTTPGPTSTAATSPTAWSRSSAGSGRATEPPGTGRWR